MHWATSMEQLSPLQVVLQQPLKQHSKQVNSLITCRGAKRAPGEAAERIMASLEAGHIYTSVK